MNTFKVNRHYVTTGAKKHTSESEIATTLAHRKAVEEFLAGDAGQSRLQCSDDF